MIRDSVQSSAGLLKVHIFRCFQKISLILCNSDIIFCITFIIKLQTSCGALELSSFSRAYTADVCVGGGQEPVLRFLKMSFMVDCDFEKGSQINSFRVRFW